MYAIVLVVIFIIQYITSLGLQLSSTSSWSEGPGKIKVEEEGGTVTEPMKKKRGRKKKQVCAPDLVSTIQDVQLREDPQHGVLDDYHDTMGDTVTTIGMVDALSKYSCKFVTLYPCPGHKY